MNIVTLLDLADEFALDADYYRNKFQNQTGPLLFSTDGTVVTARALPDETYTVAARSRHIKVIDTVPPDRRGYLTIASLGWWWYRVEQDWSALPRRNRPSRTQYALRSSRSGTRTCTYSWDHCNYCAHGRAMVHAARLLHHGLPTMHVVMRPQDAMTPLEARKAASDVLTAYTMLAPRSNLQAALIVPSFSSRTPGAANTLHLHVLLQARPWTDLLEDVAHAYGLNVQHSARKFKALDATDAGPAWVIAYALQQLDNRVLQDPSMVGQRESGPIVWTRWRSHERRIRSTQTYTNLESVAQARSRGKALGDDGTGSLDIDDLFDV